MKNSSITIVDLTAELFFFQILCVTLVDNSDASLVDALFVAVAAAASACSVCFCFCYVLSRFSVDLCCLCCFALLFCLFSLLYLFVSRMIFFGVSNGTFPGGAAVLIADGVLLTKGGGGGGGGVAMRVRVRVARAACVAMVVSAVSYHG